MEVAFASPVVDTAAEELPCLECATALLVSDRTIKAGERYVRWDCTINGESHSFALHLFHGPFRPPEEDYSGETATIFRYDMTEDMDYHMGECDECEHSMGGNGADPHVRTSEGDTLCIPCALLAGFTEFALDPETCLLTLEGHPNRKYLRESDVDTLDKLIKEGVWDAVWFTGGKAGETLPEFRAASEKWYNLGRKRAAERSSPEDLAKYDWHPLPDDAPVWDEAVDGPFWKFADAFRSPFAVAAYRAAWAYLFPSQPDPEGPCPLTQRN